MLMSIIKKNTLGQFSGRISDVIFRERNGKIVAYSKPVNQKVSQSKKAIQARNKFTLSVALAKEVNSNEILSQIWNLSEINASNSYQKLIKANSKLTSSKSLSLKNIITPNNIELNGIDLVYSKSFLEIILTSSQLNSVLLNAKKIFCLIHLWNNNQSDEEYLSKENFYLKLLEFDLPTLEKNLVHKINIDFNQLTKSTYENGIIFIALTGSESDGKIIWSSTFAKKFD